jgi:hypothetical protein
VRGPDGAIYDRAWTNTGGWLGFARLPGATSSGPGATTPGPGLLQLLARNGNSLITNGFASTWSG